MFKPGYGVFPQMYGMIDWPGKKPMEPIVEELYARRPVVIELPRLVTRRDQERFANISVYPAPDDEIPILRRLVDEYRVRLEMPPLRQRPENPASNDAEPDDVRVRDKHEDRTGGPPWSGPKCCT